MHYLPRSHAMGREVDFVVTLNRKIQWLIEVKTSDGEISNSLRYYQNKLQPKESLQLVLNLDREREKAGIKVVSLARWLEALPFGKQDSLPAGVGI